MRKSILMGALAVVVMLALSGCGNNDADVGDNGYVDGVYSASSTANERGFAWAEITIADGRITNVQLKDFNGLGMEKDWDVYPYGLAKEALDQLEQAFVDENGTDVDTVTGATTSSKNFIEAVEFALAKATPEADAGEYFDGTFMGISDPDDRGWGIAWVTVENDAIKEVELLETMPEDDGFVIKATDGDDRYHYEPYHVARQQLAEDIVEQGSTDVDAVSGATSSSAKMIQAVERALEAAQR